VVDGRVENPRVGGELLESAHAGAGTDNRHQIARLHLAIDELSQRIANVNDTFEGKPQVVDDQSKHAAHAAGRG
jgi:hypothetical protein